MNEWIDKIRNATLKQALIFFMAILPLAPAAKGVWEFGVEARLWGTGKGRQEQVNLSCMKANFGLDPKESKMLVDGETDKILFRLYESGDILIVRRKLDEFGDTKQDMLWLPKRCAPAETQFALNLVSEAYASPKTIYTVNSLWRDEVMGWLDAFRVVVKRTHSNGCVEIIVVDAATGQILEKRQSTCVGNT